MTTEMPRIDQGQYTLLELLPAQGEWDAHGYLWLSGQSPRLIELVDGHIEAVSMPTERHQSIVIYLLWVFRAYAKIIGGIAFIAPLRLQLWNQRFREPDVLLLCDANDSRRASEFWTGADLVLEVVSLDDPKRDLVDKRVDYAQAGIPEYWIVNPINERITVLQLHNDHYEVFGDWGRGELACSALLEHCSVSVSEVFDAE